MFFSLLSLCPVLSSRMAFDHSCTLGGIRPSSETASRALKRTARTRMKRRSVPLRLPLCLCLRVCAFAPRANVLSWSSWSSLCDVCPHRHGEHRRKRASGFGKRKSRRRNVMLPQRSVRKLPPPRVPPPPRAVPVPRVPPASRLARPEAVRTRRNCYQSSLPGTPSSSVCHFARTS